MTPDPETQPQFYDGIPVKRLVAWLADTVVIFLICLLIIPLTAFIGIFFFPLLFMCVGFVYRVATLANGSATWGMRLMAMELRTANDRLFDLSTAFLHTLGYSLSLTVVPVQILSIILMLTSERKQGLTDMVLGTVPLNRRV